MEVLTEAAVGDELLLAVRPEDVVLRLQEGGAGRRPQLAQQLGRVDRLGRLRRSPRAGWGILHRARGGCSCTGGPCRAAHRRAPRLRSGRGEPEQALLASVTRSSVEEMDLAPGVGVVASVKATAIHVLER